MKKLVLALLLFCSMQVFSKDTTEWLTFKNVHGKNLYYKSNDNSLKESPSMYYKKSITDNKVVYTLDSKNKFTNALNLDRYQNLVFDTLGNFIKATELLNFENWDKAKEFILMFYANNDYSTNYVLETVNIFDKTKTYIVTDLVNNTYLEIAISTTKNYSLLLTFTFTNPEKVIIKEKKTKKKK